MSSRDPNPDLKRAIEDLMSSPAIGCAVANTLIFNATERQACLMIAEVRMRRALRAYAHNTRAAANMPREASARSPWARPS